MYGPRGDFLGKRPLYSRRLSGIAGILPVNVPTGLELEVEAYLVRAFMKMRVRSDELDMDVGKVSGVGCRECRQNCEEQSERGDRTKETHQD